MKAIWEISITRFILNYVIVLFRNFLPLFYLAAWMAWSCCIQADELKPITVQVNGKINFAKSGYVAAIEQGYYADEGLEVTLSVKGDNNEDIQNLLLGKAQFANSGIKSFLDFLDGKPLVALGAIYQDTDSVIITRHDSGIATLADLIGKTVINTGYRQDDEVMMMIRSAGVKLNEVDFVRHDRKTLWSDYLFKKSADAVIIRSTLDAYAPYLQAELLVRTFKPADYGYRVYQNLIITSQDYLKQNPETCQAFYQATIRGWRYAITHPNEMVALYHYRYNDLGESETRLTQRVINSYERVGVEGIGVMTTRQWRQIAKGYRMLGLGDRGIDITPFVYDPDEKPDLAWVRWVVGVGAGAIVLAVVVLAWNYQLRRRVDERTHSLSQSEQRQKLMMQELDHRVKNNLAAIMSLSRQTLGASDTLTDFDDVFSARLHAMAGTHEALAKNHWEGLGLMEIIRLTLRNELERTPESMRIEGLEITLPQSVVTSVSLALHELATNAFRHGAWTSEGGCVCLSWEVTNAQVLVIQWEETGGQSIEAPLTPGVGMGLIKGLIEFELQGEVEWASAPSGLRCSLRIPMTPLHAAQTDEMKALNNRAKSLSDISV